MYGPSVRDIPPYYGQGFPFCSPTQMFFVQARLCIGNSYLLHKIHHCPVWGWGGGQLDPEGRGSLILWLPNKRKLLPQSQKYATVEIGGVQGSGQAEQTRLFVLHSWPH